MNLSTPQYVLPDYLCRFAVRVPPTLTLSPFSREYDYPHYQVPPKGTPYFRLSAQPADLPADLIAYGLKRPIPSGRGGVTAPSGHHCMR